MDTAAMLRETILDKLRSRAWRAGHRIPTERALSEEFSISRSTVRRVLADLKRRRLITQTVGSGTYVTEQVHEALAELTPAAGVLAVSPAELMSARLVLEPALIEMAIGNATAADFARMDECNHHAERAPRWRNSSAGTRPCTRRLPMPRTTVSSPAFSASWARRVRWPSGVCSSAAAPHPSGGWSTSRSIAHWWLR